MYNNFVSRSLRAEPRNVLIREAPEAQFVRRQKPNYFLLRFPSQWQTILKGMITVTINTDAFCERKRD